MERFAKDIASNKENVEELEEWRMLKDEAPHKAEELIAQIEGYADMDLNLKIEALNAKEEELLEGGNENRFIAKEVARQREMLKAQMTYGHTMRSLGVVV